MNEMAWYNKKKLLFSMEIEKIWMNSGLTNLTNLSLDQFSSKFDHS